MADRDIVTRAGKASPLSAIDYDQNINGLHGTVETQSGTTYTVIYTDQGKTIELNNASMVCTLDSIATIAAAIDTDNFEVAIHNINAASATVNPTGNTINGTSSVTINGNDCWVFQTNAAGNNWIVKARGGDVATLDGSPVFTSNVLINKASPNLALQPLDELTENAILYYRDELGNNRALVYRPINGAKLRLDARDAGGTVQAALEITEAGGIDVVIGTFSATGAALTTPTLTSPTINTPVLNLPAFRAESNAAQAMSGTATKILFAVENFDKTSDYATSRFTPSEAGVYLIHTCISLSATPPGTFNLWIYKNGAIDRLISNYISASNETIEASVLMEMNGSTDYVEIFGQLAGISAASIQATGRSNYFEGHRVSS